MTSRQEIENLEAEEEYYRDRVALLRAKRYRWGLGSSERLRALERSLARARHRVREARVRVKP